jgi:hypothetical protein
LLNHLTLPVMRILVLPCNFAAHGAAVHRDPRATQ